MKGAVLLYLAAGFLVFWGVGHLFPARGVVRSFGAISRDNRRILLMEWITEGVALIFLGVLLAAVTMVGAVSDVSRTVYWLVSGVLVLLSGVSLFTGARVAFIAYRLCPVIFLTAAGLIQVGMRL